MRNTRLSASPVAIAIVAVLLAASPAQAAILGVKSVGEIFVDAQGRASGQNIATRIHDTEGLIEDFHAVPLDALVFDAVRIAGFTPSEKIAGVGSAALILRGSNAVVTVHDNVHSVVQIKTLQATTVTYELSQGVEALQEGKHGAVVRLTDTTKGYVGHLVAVGTEGPSTRGEVMQVRAGEVVARAQPNTQILFFAKAAAGRSDAMQQTLVQALAEGSLVSHAVTEFTGSRVAASQVDVAPHANSRTTTLASGIVETALTTRAKAASVLAYDLAFETLPARNADDVAVYVDGALAQRSHDARDVLAAARTDVPASFAILSGGRTQVLVAAPQTPGEHSIIVTVGASASTESQSRAESSGHDDARVYGGFEYHSNGKLTGEFLTSVIPDGRATLLSFTELATRTEVFRSASIDGGAAASFHSVGDDELRLETPKADLTLIDDAYATLIVTAKAPSSVAFELASGVSARRLSDDILTLHGPNGPAGALILTGDAASKDAANLQTDARGQIDAALVPGARLVYRGALDAHASEDALLRALADGSLTAQVLAGVQFGGLVARATTFVDDTSILVRPEGRALRIDHNLAGHVAGSFAIDVRGAALVVKGPDDVRVILDGLTLSPSHSAEDVLAVDGPPAYFAQMSLDGALRLIVRTHEGASTILVDSLVEEAARAQARTDAFGAFKTFHDGTAVGSFVTLKADQAAGAISGFTMVAAGRPIFASFAAGHSAFVSTGADGASVLHLANREARIDVLDSTNGFTKISAQQETDAAFHLADGLHAEQRGPGVVELLTAQGEHVASVLVTRGGELQTRGDGEIRAHLALGGELVFRTHAGIESELSAAQRTMINQAIAGGRIAGQVIVQTQVSANGGFGHLERTARTESEGLSAEAQQALGQLTSTVTASYGDIHILTTATKARVELTIGSVTEAGRTLLVSLDPDTIPGMATGKATIRYDGELVAQASSYADILDPADDDGAAEYFVLAGDAGTQVLVSIPHFSVHTVTLEQRAEKPDTLYMYATLFLGLLVVVESALLARGARQKHTINTRRP